MGKLTDDDMTAAEGSDDKFLEKVPWVFPMVG
jgi:uncharacterized protein YjbJ (UPF0337 family)